MTITCSNCDMPYAVTTDDHIVACPYCGQRTFSPGADDDGDDWNDDQDDDGLSPLLVARLAWDTAAAALDATRAAVTYGLDEVERAR